MTEIHKLSQNADAWIFDYLISVAFYALIEFSLVNMEKAEFQTGNRMNHKT